MEKERWGIWSVQLALDTGHVQAQGALRTLRGENIALYIHGAPLDAQMRPVEDARLLALLAQSPQNLQGLNGAFAGMLVSGGHALVFCDRSTLCKAFVCVDGGTVYAADSAHRIAGLRPARPLPNLGAWSEMLKWGSLFTRETYYEGIYLLQIGEAAQIGRGPGSKSTQWLAYDTVFARNVLDERPLEQIADSLLDALRAALDNAWRQGGFAGTVSGGMDSRLLLGLLREMGHMPELYSVDNDNYFDERAMIRVLLDYLGMESTHVRVEADYFQQYARRCIAATEGYCIQHMWFAPLADRIAQAPRARLMTGIGAGELLRFDNGYARSAVLGDLFAGGKQEALEDQLYAFGSGVDGLFQDDFAHAINEGYRTQLRKSVTPYLNRDRGAMDWLIKTRLFNQVVFIDTMFADAFDGFAPFLDTSALDIVLSIPMAGIARAEALYSMFYDRVDPRLLELPHTRQEAAREWYAHTPRINRAAPVDWLRETLLEGPLVRNGMLSEEKLCAYIERMHASGRYRIDFSLRALLAMNEWYGAYASIGQAPPHIADLATKKEKTIAPACFVPGGELDVRLEDGVAVCAPTQTEAPKYLYAFARARTPVTTDAEREALSFGDARGVHVSVTARGTDVESLGLFVYQYDAQGLLCHASRKIASPQGERVSFYFPREDQALYFRPAFRFAPETAGEVCIEEVRCTLYTKGDHDDLRKQLMSGDIRVV